MRFFIIIYILLWAGTAQAQSQAAELRLERNYAGSHVDAALDNLGNLYLVTSGGQIKKFGPAGDSLGVFNQVRRNGSLHTLDVSNPLRPLLFYKDFAQVVVLDRFLSAQLTLDLRRSGVLQPAAVGQSFDNKIWVFDGLANKLKKLDEQGNTLLETPDLRVIFAGGIQPQHIFDQNGWVYLYDPAQGLFAFDYYGTFRRKMPITGWRNVTVNDKVVVGFTEEGLQTYNSTNLMQGHQPLPAALKGCRDLKLGNKKLVALCTEGARLFSLAD